MKNKLPLSFFQSPDVVQIARDLLGKVLCTHDGTSLTAGLITETEAYNGIGDKACHAYNNRRTARTETMYLPGGAAYVYLCYGMHHLFNIVTGAADNPQAVLIRAVEPLDGVAVMALRRQKKAGDYRISAGPGAMSAALGITTADDGTLLDSGRIWLENRSIIINDEDIIASARIGVHYAGEDALLPYRFYLKNNLYVSKRS